MSDNRGAQALRRRLEKTTQQDLAKRLGLEQGRISRYATGKTLPRRAAALALKRIGIGIEWWDQPPEQVEAERRTA